MNVWSLLIFLILWGAPAPLWIAVGMRIQGRRLERIEEIQAEARRQHGIRLHSIRIRR